RIIEDLMSLSRIEADRFVAPGERVEIEDIVTTAVGNAGRVPCEFKIALAPELPPVRGDRAQLVQVLDNLLGNAVRYGCDKPGAAIEVSAELSAPWVALTVTDQRPGILREQLPRSRERSYRVEPGRNR